MSEKEFVHTSNNLDMIISASNYDCVKKNTDLFIEALIVSENKSGK